MGIPSDLRWKATGNTLGQGGQAAVHEVEDAHGTLPGRYALKALSRNKPAKAYERFAREVDAIKAINHPSIIRIVDHSSPDAAFQFYVMELDRDAKPLSKLLGTPDNPYFRNSLASLTFLTHLVSAIEACEQAGVVHRDLSPANVLILPDGGLKIIDFGICQIDDKEAITLIDEGVGTPNYMAPECEPGAPEPTITSRADLYSVGKLLWSAVTNLHAFPREAPAFNHKSMESIFPEEPVLWHFHHVFENTIRHSPAERWPSAAKALKRIHYLRYLIMSGYPPIELLTERCPICGVGSLQTFQEGFMLFGNPNPPGFQSVQCTYCGFCFARNHQLAQQTLAKRARLS